MHLNSTVTVQIQSNSVKSQVPNQNINSMGSLCKYTLSFGCKWEVMIFCVAVIVSFSVAVFPEGASQSASQVVNQYMMYINWGTITEALMTQLLLTFLFPHQSLFYMSCKFACKVVRLKQIVYRTLIKVHNRYCQ